MTGWEREVLLAPRTVQPAPERWAAPVPLVLVADLFEPAGVLPRPVSNPRDGAPPGTNLMWVDASTDDSLVRSLARAGHLQLATSRPTR